MIDPIAYPSSDSSDRVATRKGYAASTELDFVWMPIRQQYRNAGAKNIAGLVMATVRHVFAQGKDVIQRIEGGGLNAYQFLGVGSWKSGRENWQNRRCLVKMTVFSPCHRRGRPKRMSFRPATAVAGQADCFFGAPRPWANKTIVILPRHRRVGAKRQDQLGSHGGGRVKKQPGCARTDEAA